MGYKLRRWLADRLPADLSSGERLVALEIADRAWDETSRAYGDDVLEGVARRCGFADTKQVGKVLAKLGARGIELRVAVGKDKQGRPVYAHRGRQTTYRIPTAEELGLPTDPPAGEVWEMDPRQGDLSATIKDPHQGDHSPASTPERSPAGGERSPAGGERSPAGGERSPAGGRKVPRAGDPTSSHHLSTPRSLSPAALLAKHGVAEGEREKLIATLEARHHVDGLGWWIAADRNGTLPQRIAEAITNADTPTAAKPRPGQHQPYRDSPTANYHAAL